jgi:hypothetical protein
MREWRCRDTFLTSELDGDVVIFTPRTLLPRGKSSRYPLDRRLGGPRAGPDAVPRQCNQQYMTKLTELSYLPDYNGTICIRKY